MLNKPRFVFVKCDVKVKVWHKTDFLVAGIQWVCGANIINMNDCFVWPVRFLNLYSGQI